MKFLASSTLLLLLSLTGALPLAAQSKEQLVVALSAPGKPGRLQLKLVNGSIKVQGYNGKDVVIDVAQRSNSRDTGPTTPTPPGMRRLSKVSGLDISAQERDNTVYVRSLSPPSSPIDFTIKVPRQFSLTLATVNDGDITVDNVSGELELSNVNGDIRLDDVAGSAVLNTVNGEVTAKFNDLTSGTPMAFSTVNGKIDVSLPTKTKASLKLKSDRGDIFSDFDMSTDAAGTPKVNRTGKDGTYRISTDSWTYGKINGGGAEFMMKTLNGDIVIRKAK
ncbi:DUF4097 family beta strand repeat-containing protein [Hymenobacter sp. CRA2]|uniref:DUF4097 family beta strand repeat-containing protein n=1 Tax=Hymenobacter sp. CRA2 TaxID=1955620 RepID=UPI00098E9AE7|nr:DUF4097 family beta strand repeat-containing protein [Hymenobacter sp. CRA2]OON69708.1 hypothetical protein B0919_07195 [Hymenobacter sp. CRA2]